MFKRLNTIAVLFFAVIAIATAQLPEYRNYNIESGYIKYELSGLQTGTQETYFKNWGRDEVKITVAKMQIGQEVQNINTTFIITNENMVNFDRVTKQGVKFPPPDLAQVYQIWEEERGDFDKVQTRLIEQSGMTHGGSEKILGKKCQIWENFKDGRKLKIWSWKGIQLKIEQTFQGAVITQTAVKFQEGFEVSDELFIVPEDIKWTDPMGTPIN